MSESQRRKSASWSIVTTTVKTEYLAINHGIGLMFGICATEKLFLSDR